MKTAQHADGHARTPAARARRRDRAATVVPYDFSRPIQLSREHTRMLQIAFDGFARQATTVFTSVLRTVCQVNLIVIEQRSYAEYVDGLDALTHMTIFSADPLPGRCVMEIPLETSMAAVDHMLGGHGRGDQPHRALSEIESNVMSGLIDRLLAEMRYSMSGLVAIDPEVRATEYSPQFAQVAGAGDVVVLLSFELKIGDRDSSLSLCMPFSSILPHLVGASSPAPASDRERAELARSAKTLRQQFDQVPVDVQVRFRPTALTPEALHGISVGDVVRLNHPSSAPLDVVVDGTTFAHATPGARGAHLAALIVPTQESTS
ncbi:flagellar motor switch protein FliM [Aeromicrobium massiliense]|uniref:flagellar motor switch protein FliM n=1 Tax=Aeromicrobium massiliense TaxID=1464554 RepID=UPI00030BB9F4|nr:flagellar motor switch protein FliM [Aeromicrobium massiliense]